MHSSLLFALLALCSLSHHVGKSKGERGIKALTLRSRLLFPSRSLFHLISFSFFFRGRSMGQRSSNRYDVSPRVRLSASWVPHIHAIFWRHFLCPASRATNSAHIPLLFDLFLVLSTLSSSLPSSLLSASLSPFSGVKLTDHSATITNDGRFLLLFGGYEAEGEFMKKMNKFDLRMWQRRWERK